MKNYGNYILNFNELKNVVDFLAPIEDKYNWIGVSKKSLFGVPFVNGTVLEEKNLDLNLIYRSEDEIALKSKDGLVELKYIMRNDYLNISAKMPKYYGPRTGIHFDFNFLDSSDEDENLNQIVLSTIYTDENQNYGYFIFSRPNGRYMLMTINKSFAAWRLKYSYCGHRVLGLQILSEASDVIDKGSSRQRLNLVDELDISISFANSLCEAYEKISKILDITIVKFNISGGTKGAKIPLEVIGDNENIVKLPSGYKVKLENNFLDLLEEGIYEVKSRNREGKIHISRILCHKNWKEYFNLINKFYKDYFQLDGGAFARAIWKESLSPKYGVQYEGVAFGDENSNYSCRTGEFGGFAGWAIIKNLLMFGKNDEYFNSAKKYIRDWALSEGRKVPYTSTVCKYAHDGWSPYHLYKEVNFPQYEVWLIEQLIDYYKITENDDIYEDLICLADHFINDHINEEGIVLNVIHDYCTVHVPSVAFIKLANLVKEKGNLEKSERYYEVSDLINNYILSREFNFPTEGEPCTEDGSIGCAALSLLYSYYHYRKNEKYLEFGKKLLDFHNALVMDGFDCRMKGSSIRFWETLYETRDCGPSYNAGHSWSLWSGEARFYLSLITGELKYLKKAYNAFVANMCKVDKNGGMSCSYIPDMIPGIPHDEKFGGIPGAARETTAVLGMKYPSLTYSASGNYFLIKYAETFNRLAGIDFNENIIINGFYKNDEIITNTTKLEELIIEGKPSKRIKLSINNPIIITYNEDINNLKLSQCHIEKLDFNKYRILNKSNFIIMG